MSTSRYRIGKVLLQQLTVPQPRLQQHALQNPDTHVHLHNFSLNPRDAFSYIHERSYQVTNALKI